MEILFCLPRPEIAWENKKDCSGKRVRTSEEPTIFKLLKKNSHTLADLLFHKNLISHVNQRKRHN